MLIRAFPFAGGTGVAKYPVFLYLKKKGAVLEHPKWGEFVGKQLVL